MTYEQYAVFRDSKGMKDAQVASLANIGRSTFSDWKSGRSEPKTEKLDKIRRALGLSIPEFFEDQEDSTIREISQIVMNNARSQLEDKAFAHGVEDAQLLQKYHQLSSANQAVIKSTLDALLAAQDASE